MRTAGAAATATSRTRAPACARAHSQRAPQLTGAPGKRAHPTPATDRPVSRTLFLIVGFSLGGFGIGEQPGERRAALEAAVSALPEGKPRHISGLGMVEEARHASHEIEHEKALPRTALCSCSITAVRDKLCRAYCTEAVVKA